MYKGIFLDRDGVLTKLVFYSESNEYEAPHFAKDFEMMEDVIDGLLKLKKMKFKLFLISNQPDYAKGKTTLSELKDIEKKFKDILKKNKVELDEYCYCYHHPEGIVPEYTLKCKCRKPGTFFIEKTKEKYNLDLKNSWFIGDLDNDIFCGQKAGVKTIIIENTLSKDKRGNSNPDFKAKNIREAVKIIEFETIERNLI